MVLRIACACFSGKKERRAVETPMIQPEQKGRHTMAKKSDSLSTHRRPGSIYH